MTVHYLKTHPTYFKAVQDGIKNFEIRNNLDRGFQTGDTVILKEFHPDLWCESSEQYGLYTGNQQMVKITYVSNFEQRRNFIVFGFYLIDKPAS